MSRLSLMMSVVEVGKVKISDVIAPSFYEVYEDVKSEKHTHYVLNGGRGSTKSSFISVVIILGLVQHPGTHAVVMRKVAETLRDSVFAQMLWAISILGLSSFFKATQSPLKITYLPTGQTILFRGADDPMKLKSIKPPFGYFRYVWYEEWNQFGGMEETRSINQSLLRGSGKYTVFYSYNPPESVRDWVNEEVREERSDRLVHHSTYETVPEAWLGEQFLIEARHLQKTQPERYRHEYLGEVTGTGGEVFKNITIRRIEDSEIARFDHVKRGLDWGYATDPFAYVVCHYDKTRRRLYIYFEIYKVELSNRQAAQLIKQENRLNREIIADSAEPKSIAEMYEYGLHVIGAKKGPDSVKYGIEWLRDLEEIIIDKERCPNIAKEFLNYELDRDKSGNFKANYPDRDNHGIDAVRYATENDQRNVKIS